MILSGVKSVTLQDTVLASGHDFASQFYLPEESAGLNRAQVGLPDIFN